MRQSGQQLVVVRGIIVRFRPKDKALSWFPADRHRIKGVRENNENIEDPILS